MKFSTQLLSCISCNLNEASLKAIRNLPLLPLVHTLSICTVDILQLWPSIIIVRPNHYLSMDGAWVNATAIAQIASIMHGQWWFRAVIGTVCECALRFTFRSHVALSTVRVPTAAISYGRNYVRWCIYWPPVSQCY